MKQSRVQSFFKEISKNRVLYLMFLPVAIFFIMFMYIPMGGIVIAFKELNYRLGIFGSPWNGFENFRYFFVSGKALSVTLNTMKYNLIFLGCFTVFSIVIAILLSEMSKKWFKKLTQSFMFLPYFISWVIVSALVYNILNYEFGVLNITLGKIGLPAVDVYSNPDIWVIILPVLYIWKWVGYGSVIYLAAISGIDQECYEAATIDGATALQKVFKITLPLLKPTIIILVLLGLGRIMRGEFDMFYNIIGNNCLLLDSTDIIDTLVFRSLVGIQDFGMASASSFYQSILCFLFILVVNGVARRVDKDYALF